MIKEYTPTKRLKEPQQTPTNIANLRGAFESTEIAENDKINNF